jgi:hypothetical protein
MVVVSANRGLFYVTSGNSSNRGKYITSADSTAPVANIHGGMYIRGGVYTAFKEQNGNCVPQSVILYKEIDITDGILTYTGNAYLVDNSGTGTQQCYKSASSASTIYTSSLNMGINNWTESSYSVHCIIPGNKSVPETSITVGILTGDDTNYPQIIDTPIL